jgi:hypothetical protein
MSRYRVAYNDPDGDRYGIPTFQWRRAPDGYATVRQLRERGLRPGGQPVAAQVMWHGIGGARVAYLYLLDRAKPKRTATAAQRRAIGRALLARRTCSTCGWLQPYYIPRSLGECLDCARGGHRS